MTTDGGQARMRSDKLRGIKSELRLWQHSPVIHEILRSRPLLLTTFQAKLLLVELTNPDAGDPAFVSRHVPDTHRRRSECG